MEATKIVNGQQVEFVPPPMDIPAEKLEAMKKYAKELHVKFPHMKPLRLQRKVAEYFKVKLVNNEKPGTEDTSG